MQYNTTAPTKDNVIATLKVSDAGVGIAGTDGVTCGSNAVTIVDNKDGSYTLTISEDVKTTLVMKDALGNRATVPIVVNCIDKVAPVVKIQSATPVTSGARTDAEITVTVAHRLHQAGL